jgi:hypothetical protein
MNSAPDRRLTEASEAGRDVGRYDLNRWPLAYIPRSSTQVNRERLPDPADLSEMELAYREQAADEETLRRSAHNLVFAITLIALIGSALLLSGLLLLPPGFVIGLAGTIALLAFCYSAIVNREVSLRLLLYCIAFPLAAAIAVILITNLLQHRIFGTSILLTLSILGFWRYGRRPLQFYHTWLYAAPHLTPDERRTQEPLRSSIDYRAAAVLIPVILFVPMLVPSIAVFLTLLVCAWFCSRVRGGLDLLPLASDVLGRYLTYRPLSGAAGVWHPSRRMQRGAPATLALLSLAFATITIGLCFFLPTRMLSHPLSEIVDDEIRYADNGMAKTLYRELEWQRADDNKGIYLGNKLADRPQLGVFFFINLLLLGKHGYSWLLLLSLVLLLILPPYVLLTLYRPALLELSAKRDQLRDRQIQDQRPEWQWYVDRLNPSRHEAIDPVTGRTVREAEHLFLGIESVQKFPILLDKRILAEHAYIVGETGSGKTSMGIMPILMQLIRGHATPPGSRSPYPTAGRT